MSANSLPDSAAVWHSLEVDKALELLSSHADTGLTPQEVETRLQKYGPNELEESGGRSAWEILLDQFKNVMLLMLIGVAIISGVLDLLSLQAGTLKSGEVPFKDTIAILAIVILNGILGYVQESRAEKALAALKKLSSPNVRLIRNGRLVDVAAKETGARRYHASGSRSPNSRRWTLNRTVKFASARVCPDGGSRSR